MKIILNEVTKEGVLLKEDGTEVSRYPFEDAFDEEFTFEDFKRDIDGFNAFLSQQEEFDTIEELDKYVEAYEWA